MPNCVFLNCFLVSLFTALTGFAEPLEVRTRDGLGIQFAPDQILGVTVATNHLRHLSGGGFWIRDVTQSKDFEFVPGKFSKGKQIHFLGETDDLVVSADFAVCGDCITVDGIVRNKAAQEERCADLKFILPFDCTGWKWGADLVREVSIEKEIRGERADGLTMYPLAPASQTNLDAGVSLAIPPLYPTLFETGAGKQGLFVLFKLGFSSAAEQPGETPFHFIVYRHDPTWGFRSSLQKYYDLFREPFFVRRVKKVGAWGWHHPSPSELPNRDLYAFHESAGETWKIKDEGMHGYEHEGINQATNMADFVRLTRVADDEKSGIYSLPYTIVGQRQVYHLPKMPETREAALIEFEKWTTKSPMIFQSPGPSISFRSADQLKEMIRNSCVYDQQQKPDILMRQYLGNTLTFPLNPNPRLFFDSTKLTIAKYTLDEYLPMLLAGSAMIDGCYVDSLGRWPGYYNFRREHFKYTSLPLTYSGKDPQPCIWNLQSHAEYLSELSKRFHAKSKLVFANGIHPSRVMLGFYVDVLGEEGGSDYTKSGFFSKRVAAYDKPFCVLNGRDNVNLPLWNSCLYQGILIGARSKQGQTLERKFLPSIIRLNEAGWRPVTLARSDSPALGIERWGDGHGKPVFFSLMNRSKKKIEAVVHVRAGELGLRNAVAQDIVSGESISLVQGGSMLDFSIALEPETSTAIKIAHQ